MDLEVAGELVDGEVQESENEDKVDGKAHPKQHNHDIEVLGGVEEHHQGRKHQQRNQLRVEVLKFHLGYGVGTLVTEEIMILQMKREAKIPKFTRIIPTYFS